MSGIISDLLAIVRENAFLTLAVLLGGYGAVAFGHINIPELPAGSAVIATGAVAVGIGGYVAAGKINDLLPDPEGIFLVAFESNNEQGGKVWELSEDQFSDIEVVNGTLFQWPTSKRVYECREYEPKRNVAVANWRESVAGSQLAGAASIPEAFASIDELRQEFEPESRKYRYLQRRLRGIVRKADKRRLRDQQQILDENMAPSFESDDATVSAVLRDELPDELLPESMTGETQEKLDKINAERNGHDGGDLVGFDLLEDGEALEPTDDMNQ